MNGPPFIRKLEQSLLIEKIIGKVDPINLNASLTEKIKTITFDFFTNTTTPFLRLLRLPVDDATVMRQKVEHFTEKFNGSFRRRDRETLKPILKAFSDRAKSIDPLLTKQETASLFIETIKTLSERKNPTPTLNKRNLELLTNEIHTQLGLQTTSSAIESQPPVELTKNSCHFEPIEEILISPPNPSAFSYKKMTLIAAGFTAVALASYLLDYTNTSTLLATTTPPQESEAQNTPLAQAAEIGKVFFASLIPSSFSLFTPLDVTTTTTSALIAFLSTRSDEIQQLTEQCKISKFAQDLWNRCQSARYQANNEFQCKTVESNYALVFLKEKLQCLEHVVGNLIKEENPTILQLSIGNSPSENPLEEVQEGIQEKNICKHLKEAVYPQGDYPDDVIHAFQTSNDLVLSDKTPISPELENARRAVESLCPSDSILNKIKEKEEEDRLNRIEAREKMKQARLTQP